MFGHRAGQQDVQVFQEEQELSAQVHKLDPANQREPEPSPKYLLKQQGWGGGGGVKTQKRLSLVTVAQALTTQMCPFSKECVL